MVLMMMMMVMRIMVMMIMVVMMMRMMRMMILYAEDLLSGSMLLLVIASELGMISKNIFERELLVMF